MNIFDYYRGRKSVWDFDDPLDYQQAESDPSPYPKLDAAAEYALYQEFLDSLKNHPNYPDDSFVSVWDRGWGGGE